MEVRWRGDARGDGGEMRREMRREVPGEMQRQRHLLVDGCHGVGHHGESEDGALGDADLFIETHPPS